MVAPWCHELLEDTALESTAGCSPEVLPPAKLVSCPALSALPCLDPLGVPQRAGAPLVAISLTLCRFRRCAVRVGEPALALG